MAKAPKTINKLLAARNSLFNLFDFLFSLFFRMSSSLQFKIVFVLKLEALEVFLMYMGSGFKWKGSSVRISALPNDSCDKLDLLERLGELTSNVSCLLSFGELSRDISD